MPSDLPIPQDDGGAKHFPGMAMPGRPAHHNGRGSVNFSKLPGRMVIYAYPRTGEPGKAPPEGWAAIPGAMGCTPQSCGFRDHFAELRRDGAAHVFGLPPRRGIIRPRELDGDDRRPLPNKAR